MIELGKIQTLKLVKFTDFGAYLSDGVNNDDRVLLPMNRCHKAQI